MSYGGILAEGYTKAVIEPFEAKNPDIRVKYVPGGSGAEMLGTLRSQKGNPQVDIAMFDISMSQVGNQEGIFAPLDSELVPNLADISERGQVEGNFGPAATFDKLTLLHNTDEVEKAPSSWNDLWNDEFAGKVVIDGPPDLQGIFLMLIINDMLGADYKETVDPAVDKLAELAPNVQTWTPSPDPYSLVLNGSASVGIGYNARAQLLSEESGGTLGVVSPEEGTTLQINAINLVKGGDDMEAAQKFINYALSPEAQGALADQVFFAPTNVKTQVGEDAATRIGSTEGDAIIDVDLGYVASHNEEWTSVWREEIIGK